MTLLAYSWETDLTIILGDFALKKTRLTEKENLYLTKTVLIETNFAIFAVWKIITVTWVICMQTNSQIRNLVVIDKISIFQEIAQHFIYSQKL